MPPSDDMAAFRAALDKARKIAFLTGAGISAESGIPTFRGAGGLWRRFEATELATPQAFESDPGLVWEFYHYRRDVVNTCKPNPGHYAITALQRKLQAEGREVILITQNIDGLHALSGTEDVIELHGNLWNVKRVGHEGSLPEEDKVWEDRTQPLVPALAGRGAPDEGNHPTIPVVQLPHHKDGKLLRPAVVWFNESLDGRVMKRVKGVLEECDLFIVVGTSSVVYPAAGFSALVQERGTNVAEFNLEITPNTDGSTFAFQGKSGELLPDALGVRAETEELLAGANQ